MAGNLVIPPVFGAQGKPDVDEDLQISSLLWTIENRREKGGGFLRKKAPEIVTRVSVIYRPVLIMKYQGITTAFDACGIKSTTIRFGVAPSLTSVRRFLMSENWAFRPEAYASGIDHHSQDFERARDQYSYEIRGWITDSNVLSPLNAIIGKSSPSSTQPEALPMTVNHSIALEALTDLDQIKHLLQSEIGPLREIKLEINQRTTEALDPLKKQCERIEAEYNSQINKIRPSVIEAQRRYQNQKMNNLQQIEARVGKRLQALREKHDDAVAKIDSYELADRAPRGGIEKQYSIRDSTAERIRELEDERDEQVAAVNDKYDELIEQAESRIDALEDEKQNRLAEPRRKIQAVESADKRLQSAIDELISSNESVITLGSTNRITAPQAVQEDQSIVFLPFVIARFEGGSKYREFVLPPSSLREGKGLFGGLKGLVGIKPMPLDTADESFQKFVETYRDSARTNSAATALSERHNTLRVSETTDLLRSGVAKLRDLGWLKDKDAAEFFEQVREYYVPGEPPAPAVAEGTEAISTESLPALPKVRFVSHRGVEQLVELRDIDALRRADRVEFEREAKGMVGAEGRSGDLLSYLKGLRIPYNKSYCIEKGEGWVQNLLHSLLANSKFRTDLRRERVLKVGDIDGRIDFDVGGVGIEVKIFRSMQDFDRLAREMLVYSKDYGEILIPYINAGGLSNNELDDAFNLLTQRVSEVKGYFPLNCADN